MLRVVFFAVLLLIIAVVTFDICFGGTHEQYLDVGSCRIKDKRSIMGFNLGEIIRETTLSIYLKNNNLTETENWILTNRKISGIDGKGSIVYENHENGKLVSLVMGMSSWLELKNELLVGNKQLSFDDKKYISQFMLLLNHKNIKELQPLVDKANEIIR